jgi:chromosome partitioning protein
VKTLVLANQKGGVGKSAIGCQFAHYLLDLGLQVLCIDLDHQQNLTRPLKASGRMAVAVTSASDMLSGTAVDVGSAGSVLIPGDVALSTLERQPEKHNGFVNRLGAFLTEVDARFDVCIIDTNPNPDIRYAAALITAGFLLSPIELNQEAIDGIGALLHHPRYGYNKIRRVLNPALSIIGLLPNMVEGTKFQRDNFAQVARAYASLLIPIGDAAAGKFAFVPNRTAIAEAQAAGVPVWRLRQGSAAGGDVAPATAPIRTSGRDTWREMKPTFQMLARRLGIEV